MPSPPASLASASVAAPQPAWLRPLALAALALFAIFAVGDIDTWFHLRTGARMVQFRALCLAAFCAIVGCVVWRRVYLSTAPAFSGGASRAASWLAAYDQIRNGFFHAAPPR